MADWEVGFATAHINNGAWQREPGRYRVVSVGASREPVTSVGGMRITPDVALDDVRLEDGAMLVPAGRRYVAGGWEWGLRPHRSSAVGVIAWAWM
jgi:hypothetical protein